jgi:acyl transferase domain-containing protein/NAD(P)-dependent dehydrogenase (short-subunit alcohol dehydrogenase family)
MRSSSTAVETYPGITFTFPGQGSYSCTVLRELYTSYPQTAPYFHQANKVALELLKHDFLPLVTATSEKERDERLNACPNLDQIGIYLTEVLIATILIESGVRPALLVGHSFGELAALAAAGVYSIETGLRIVCHRVLALQSMAQPGAMAAISCDSERAHRCLEDLGNNSIEVSVINLPRQTVVAGKPSELEGLRAVLNPQGISLTLLKSRYPYHSSFLSSAVAPFRTALEAYDFRPASVPVYLSMEGMLYSPGTDLAQILSSQFVRPLDFKKVVETLYCSGYRTFIECGAGNIVTRLIEQNLSAKASDIETWAIAPLDGSLQQGLLKLFDGGFGKQETTSAEHQAGESGTSKSAAQLLGSMSLVVKDMSQLVQNTARLVEQVAGSLGVTPSPDLSLAESASTVERASAAAAVALRELASPAAVSPNDSRGEESSPPDKRPIAAAAHSNGNGFTARRESSPQPQAGFAREECTGTPVAIVSLGCVLPGAYDPEQYWSNILNGVSGISNLADVDPAAARDFLAGNEGSQIRVIPDKTYTLLHGSIVNVPYDGALLSPAYSKEQFDSLTNGQRLLALAVAQSLARLKVPASGFTKVQCILGATEDGSKEYDDALFSESLQTLLGTIDEPESLRRAFAGMLEEISGHQHRDLEELTQHKIYASVIERLLGSGIPTYVVDTACSSSLYSTYLGVKSLQDGECDMVLAGGVFAPGPANNTLFAQFRGLAQRQSRPFDASADGVVFGDGAGIVILKRLPDALNEGDRILAVIRGMGLSSDGRSPSINVPQVKGQGMAIKHAYEYSRIDVETVQYVEAHATATLVGDAVEFNALKEVMKRDPESPRIELGSVKALVGHTGWAAGVASLIKICKAFEAKVVPRQYNYVSPSPEIDLADSPFTIAETSHPWPENIAPYPRRAAINGFGFGGTNAHVILEEFEDAYHRRLCADLKVGKKGPMQLAVLSIGSLFPGAAGSMTTEPFSELRFRRESLHLPAKKMLLPDVTDHMDASQYLAALAAEKVFEGMPDWVRFKNAMGVVLGLESKTERGVRANERVFVDRLRRQVLAFRDNGTLSKADLNRILDKLVEHIRARNVPSGPYTLPGLMPNVTAGRIANMFDLNGPNIVVNMGEHSLLQALFVARQLLAHDDCKIVLAGGINATNADHEGEAEAVLLLALTTLEIARREGLPVLTTLSLSESDGRNHTPEEEISEVNPTLDYKGAQGAPEILRAIRRTREKSLRGVFKQSGNGAWAGRRLVFDPPSSPPKQPTQGELRTYAYVQGTPIRYYAPQLEPAPAGGEAQILKGRKILFLTDQPGRWLALESSGALAPFEYHVVCPPGAQLAKSLSVDLTSEDSIQRSLSDLAKVEFDTLIAIKDLEEHTQETLLLNNSESELVWLDLLFAVCRQSYERIQSKNIPIVALCQGAYKDGHLDPYTGLVSGFMKSLSRELGGSPCRAINTDEVNLYKTLRQVEVDLGHPGREVEVCYKEGARSIFTLAPVGNLTKDDQPFLDSDSVVIATGGARGVTAVLVEELLRRFGCRVIALGRTDPASAPENMLSMDEEAFKEYEPRFYQDELARNKGKKITDLKREYLSYRAANEVCQIGKRLQAISGKYEYQSVDITSEKAIDQVVEAAYRKYGRVDLVLHGAGIQVSKALTKKSLSNFRRIIATKLGGLSHLYKACKKHGAEHRTHFHILTSAFSYMGNDGQPDYGAANEAMARIAACMNSPDSGTHWSSMAWLGWAGVGMTRDSEFAALAASRGLRGVTKEEGQQIFSAMMNGTPATSINVLLADGEIDYYKVAIQASPPKVPQPSAKVRPHLPSPVNIEREFHVVERDISIKSAPYLVNHLVGGVPTVPGALVIDFVGEAAYQLRPDLKIIAFEQAFFRKFMKVYPNRKTRFRIESRVVSEDDRETVVKISILSDFVHGSGVTLQKDILQHESLVRMSATPLPVPRCPDTNGFEGRRSVDPYPIEGSPICLSGPFDAMKNLVIGGDRRRAEFEFADFDCSSSESRPMLSKVVLMDSLMRFGVIQVPLNDSLPVFVPEACDVMKVYFDFAKFDISKLVGTVTFTGENPRLDGDRLDMGPVAAIDANGNTLLLVERGVCLRFGEVRNGHAL